MSYFWFKFVHFAGFISWMAMLFYMPRLYVYHAENLDKPDFVKVVKKMERMLYHAIGWIAMAVTVFSGVMLIVLNPGLMKLGYFHLKLLAGILLVCYHLWLYYYMYKFEKNECRRSGKYFRAINEGPTILMFIILYAMLIMPNLPSN